MIGKIIRRHRVANVKTMRQVKQAGGPSIAYQCDVENGRRQNVGVLTLICWCNAIGVEPSKIFDEIAQQELHKPPLFIVECDCEWCDERNGVEQFIEQ
jgi:hypothetical protein